MPWAHRQKDSSMRGSEGVQTHEAESGFLPVSVREKADFMQSGCLQFMGTQGGKGIQGRKWGRRGTFSYSTSTKRVGGVLPPGTLYYPRVWQSEPVNFLGVCHFSGIWAPGSLLRGQGFPDRLSEVNLPLPLQQLGEKGGGGVEKLQASMV